MLAVGKGSCGVYATCVSLTRASDVMSMSSIARLTSADAPPAM